LQALRYPAMLKKSFAVRKILTASARGCSL
jgi:hypothetical protein